MKFAWRILRLWRVYGYLDLLAILRSPARFTLFLASDLLVNVGGFLTMLLLAERFDGIGAWTKWQVVFMLGYGSLAGALVYLFFAYNVAFISRRIGRGQFDHVLIQPQPLWMATLTDGFSPFIGGIGLAPGLVLGGLALGHGAGPVGLSWVALLPLNLLGSMAVSMGFAYIWGALAFWAPRSAEEINSTSNAMMQQLKGYPLDAVGPGLRGALLTVLPAGFIAWYPSRALLGLDAVPGAGFITPLAGLGFGLLAWAVFERGLAHYRITGSQRYLSRGHRM
ncbi:MAG: ABC-2 family transporter protein [Chloroflexi bacterium]|nr:ABC-2 family transporter protein [Chloroflexota bacterium]